MYEQARLLQRQNNINEAIRIFEQISIVEYSKGKIGLFLRLGNLYESVDLYGKAIDAYKRALTIARSLGNKKAENYISYTMLGLIED